MQQQVTKKDLRDTIEYVCKILYHFGLTTLTPDEFIKAKVTDTSEEVIINKFLLLFYEILLLNLGEFKYKLVKLEKNFDNIVERLPDMKKFIIYNLHVLKCPFLLILPDRVVLKTSSSRNFLLLLGWLIDVTNLFELYNESIFEEVNKFFSNLIIQKPTYDDTLVEINKPFKDFKGDINDVIAGYKKVVTQYKKLVKLTNYEQRISSEIKGSIELAQGEISFDEYQFLKKEENLQLLGEGFARIDRMLEYEIKSIKYREIFWGWLDDALKQQKKTFVNDPDLKFEEEVRIEDLRNLKNSPVLHLNTLISDLEGVYKTYEQFKGKMKEFDKYWNEEAQKLSSNSKIQKQFKEEIPYVMKDLEKQYPTLDVLKKNAEGMDIFLGELASHFQALFGEQKEDGYLQMQKLSKEMLEVKETLGNVKKEIDDCLEDYMRLLPKDIKIFPI